MDFPEKKPPKFHAGKLNFWALLSLAAAAGPGGGTWEKFGWNGSSCPCPTATPELNSGIQNESGRLGSVIPKRSSGKSGKKHHCALQESLSSAPILVGTLAAAGLWHWILGKFSHWKGGQAWKRLPREVGESPCLEMLKHNKLGHFVMWFSGNGGTQSKAGLDELGGLFQP